MLLKIGSQVELSRQIRKWKSNNKLKSNIVCLKNMNDFAYFLWYKAREREKEKEKSREREANHKYLNRVGLNIVNADDARMSWFWRKRWKLKMRRQRQRKSRSRKKSIRQRL